MIIRHLRLSQNALAWRHRGTILNCRLRRVAWTLYVQVPKAQKVRTSCRCATRTYNVRATQSRVWGGLRATISIRKLFLRPFQTPVPPKPAAELVPERSAQKTPNA